MSFRVALAMALLCSCTASPMLKYNLDVPAQTLSVLDAPELRDGRARFREIFCSALHEHPDRKQRTCEELLHRLRDEAPSAPQPGTPPLPDRRLRLVFVTGLFNDCARVVALPFETAVPRLRSLGYSAEILSVNGRSSSSFNAARIAESVSQPTDRDQRLVLLGYSKGAVDILEFMVAYPELASRVSAVVSVAGAINGSPVAPHLSTSARLRTCLSQVVPPETAAPSPASLGRSGSTGSSRTVSRRTPGISPWSRSRAPMQSPPRCDLSRPRWPRSIRATTASFCSTIKSYPAPRCSVT
jgi:hypothetical protein